jgi:hypothetical protein
MKALIAALPLVLLLTACEREQAPADNVAESAERLVGAKQPEPPKLAQGPYAPRDTCGDLKGAAEFRSALAAAVAERNADALVALAAEDIKLDFGGGTGRAELKKRLTAQDRELWRELGELLTLGCAANKQGGLTLPWYFDQSISDVDPFVGMIVTGESVPVMSSPEEGGETLATLSWDVVEIAALEPDSPFQKVKTTAGQEGYVATDKLRSLIGYRLLATSRNGTWRIVSLVAGD